MTQPPTSLDALLVTIVLATLAIGLPILVVLSIRFLLDRSLNLGRSKELEKLIWQLHRIASAMEHQMNLSFPPVQPGTEEPRDLAYLQQVATEPKSATPVAVTPKAAPPATNQPPVQEPVTTPPAAEQPPILQPLPQSSAEQAPVPQHVVQEPPAEVPRRAGVNSMFGF